MKIALMGPSFAGYRLLPAQIERIQLTAPGAEMCVFDEPAGFYRALAKADIAAGQLETGAVEDFGGLRWFHTWSAGVDKEPTAQILASGLRFTCSKGNGAIPIAEHTIMTMLMVARTASDWIEAQGRHEWRRHVSPELFGATVGLIGLGNIGIEIARRASAFGMRCVALRRHADIQPPDFAVDRVLGPDGLHELLGLADYLVVTAPLTAETRGMLGEPEFRAMKPGAFFICVSRGGIAEPEALRRALAEKWIAGAALDAHAVEPLPPDSPFWNLPNTLVTPHNAGTTLGTANRAVDIFVENLHRYLRNSPLLNRITAESSY